jgi:hypothetical protein
MCQKPTFQLSFDHHLSEDAAIQAASIFIMLADCFAGLQIDQMHPVAR